MPVVLALLLACGGTARILPGDPPVDAPSPPVEDWARDILSADLDVDLATARATARIRLAASSSGGASFEIGDLTIEAVTLDGLALQTSTWSAERGARMDVGVPGEGPVELVFDYALHPGDTGIGVDASGFTLLWPYACGRLYPCHSDPADGLRFGLTLGGVPEGRVAVYPARIAADAPPYMLAWAVAPFVHQELGSTPAGTRLSSWTIPALAEDSAHGTQSLLAAFSWLEEHIGPYAFGAEAGTVAVAWGQGAAGGMEHHPFWHVATDSVRIQETQIHEAAHGWFGDGVRIACWEDLTLSEGTVTWLAARILDELDPELGARTWREYRDLLATVPGTDLVLPDSCGEVDLMHDRLWNDAVYYRGAFFYQGLAERLGTEAVDRALATFYQRHVGKAARMTDMLAVIAETTGYDPTACADLWLRTPRTPRPGACP